MGASQSLYPLCQNFIFGEKNNRKHQKLMHLKQPSKEIEALKITIKEMEAHHLNEVNAVCEFIEKSVKAQMRQSELASPCVRACLNCVNIFTRYNRIMFNSPTSHIT